MRTLILSTLFLVSATSLAHADPKPPLADVTYDRTGTVPLAYGKNKDGEDAVCEYSARAGSNLKTWTCSLKADMASAAEAAQTIKKAAEDMSAFSMSSGN